MPFGAWFNPVSHHITLALYLNYAAFLNAETGMAAILGKTAVTFVGALDFTWLGAAFNPSRGVDYVEN